MSMNASLRPMSAAQIEFLRNRPKAKCDATKAAENYKARRFPETEFSGEVFDYRVDSTPLIGGGIKFAMDERTRAERGVMPAIFSSAAFRIDRGMWVPAEDLAQILLFADNRPIPRIIREYMAAVITKAVSRKRGPKESYNASIEADHMSFAYEDFVRFRAWAEGRKEHARQGRLGYKRDLALWPYARDRR